MHKIYPLLILTLVISGCRAAPFKVERLSIKGPIAIESTDQHGFEKILNQGMKERYKKAKSPSFGLIDGFYRLPRTKPFGAASIVRSYSYQTYFEAIEIGGKEHAYAIEPITGDDAIGLHQALNALLDIGVKIKDISMSDALTIAKAESQAAKDDHIFKALPPDVDYLMSIYPSTSARGPVLIGRVIKKDGSLVAFRVVYRGTQQNLVGDLIISLFEDTISRI